MSNKDRLRAEAGTVMRDGKLVTIAEAEAMKPKPAEKTINCLKCGRKIPLSEVEQHIIDCQGGKATCGKCGNKIDAIGFMNHFKTCPGKLALTHEINDEEPSIVIQRVSAPAGVIPPQVELNIPIIPSPIRKELEIE